MNNLIHQAYEGEVYGIAFFSYFENVDDNNEQIKLWSALVAVETLTAELLLKHLLKLTRRYEFKTAEMTEKGDKEAKKWSHLPWPELMLTLSQWVEPYEIKYRDWLLQCQQQHNQENKQLEPIFKLIAEHETAIYQCFKAELNQQDGRAPLTSFLDKYSQA
ncbi:hypothetical protein [Shewanella donghaensis]|uniref:hypothetical protein n=1 Tax=Shewanella donghaensis TaxID=238836 RepID=UPI0011827F3C|nr:hypothetical protein [Shewanella donghaensis]